MKKNTWATLLLMLSHFFCISQTVLPSTWSFTNVNLPNGWFQSGTTFYSTSGNTPPACKFDDTGDILTIHFSNAPGNLSYYLAGNSFANGTFVVEQSIDSSKWLVVHSHSSSMSSAYTLYTDTLLNTSRYLRFKYFNKSVGNVGLDDVSIQVPVAAGSMAMEPSVQASNLVFLTVKSFRIAASFTHASPAPEGYIVLRKTGSATTNTPMDGTVYQRGDMIGGSKVVFSGNATTFSPNNIVANTTYYFSIFAYNGSGASRNYLSSNPLTGMITSLGSMQPSSYYDSISTSSPTFVSDLHNKINPHIKHTYSNYGPKLLTPFIARDTTGNQRVVTCVYSGENKIYSEPWAWTTNGFSREHTFAQSWMPTVNASNFQSLPEYSDYHQLFPVNQNDANAVRSNYPLGEVLHVISTYLQAKIGTNANGQKVYEPRNEHKGDAARSLMYQAVCYDGINGFSWKFPDPISNTIPYGQDQSILKKWHDDDPPDNYEIARNDFIDSLQHNRNPFIDRPEYACYIDFSNMTTISSPEIPCYSVGVTYNNNTEDIIHLSPNPSNGNFILNYFTTKNQNITISIKNILGRTLFNTEQKINSGKNTIDMNLQNFNNGMYVMEVLAEDCKQSIKLLIN